MLLIRPASCRTSRSSGSNSCGPSRLHRLVDGLLDRRALIAQVRRAPRARRPHIVAISGHVGRRRRPAVCGKPIPQLDDQPLGGLAADAGNPREPREIGLCESRARDRRGSMPESIASASFGPMPFTPISRSNSVQLERRLETEELNGVLAHVRVDAQRDARARVADRVERGQRHLHFVADAADVDHEPLDVLLEKRAGEMRDHGAWRLRDRRQLHVAPAALVPRRARAGAVDAPARPRARGRSRSPARRRHRAATAPCRDRAAASPSAAAAPSRRGRIRPRPS